jgi:hypothetical protein
VSGWQAYDAYGNLKTTGSTGPTGATGAAGPTGATGTAGGSNIIAHVATNYSLTGTTTETSIISGATQSSTTGLLIPANTMGANGQIRFHLHGDAENDTGSSQTQRFRIYFGDTVIWDLTPSAWSNVGSTTKLPFWLSFMLSNLGATNSNKMVGQFFIPAGGYAPSAATVGTYIYQATAQMESPVTSIDTTANVYLDFSVVLGSTNAALNFNRYSSAVELL